MTLPPCLLEHCRPAARAISQELRHVRIHHVEKVVRLLLDDLGHLVCPERPQKSTRPISAPRAATIASNASSSRLDDYLDLAPSLAFAATLSALGSPAASTTLAGAASTFADSAPNARSAVTIAVFP